MTEDGTVNAVNHALSDPLSKTPPINTIETTEYADELDYDELGLVEDHAHSPSVDSTSGEEGEIKESPHERERERSLPTGKEAPPTSTMSTQDTHVCTLKLDIN